MRLPSSISFHDSQRRLLDYSGQNAGFGPSMKNWPEMQSPYP
jgi:hypothetical protein